MTDPSRTWLQDFVDLAGAQVLTSLLRFQALAWAARHLGPSGFALVSVGIVVNGYFIAAAMTGLDIRGTRDVAASAVPPRFIADATALRAVIACSVLVTAIPIVWLAGLERDLAQVITLLAFSLVPLAFDPRWALIGLRSTRPVASAELASAAINLAVVMVFVHSRRDILYVPAAQLLGDSVRALFLRRALRRIGMRSTLRWAPGALRHFLSSLPLSGALLIRSAVVTLDVVIVGAMRPKAEAGQYAVASRLYVVGLGFLGLYYQVLLPRLVLARAAGRAAQSQLLALGRSRALFLVAPLVGLASAISPFVIPTLLGDEYRQGGRLFAVLVWALACVALTGLYNQVLVVHHRERDLTVIVTVALAVDVLGNILLLPRIGVVGAPIAAVASEVVALVMTVIVARAVITSDGVEHLSNAHHR